MMSWLEVFLMQIVLFIAGVVVYVTRFYLERRPLIGPFPLNPKGTWTIVLFLWFVMGTYFRHETQMPLLGVWARLFN